MMSSATLARAARNKITKWMRKKKSSPPLTKYVCSAIPINSFEMLIFWKMTHCIVFVLANLSKQWDRVCWQCLVCICLYVSRFRFWFPLNQNSQFVFNQMHTIYNSTFIWLIHPQWNNKISQRPTICRYGMWVLNNNEPQWFQSPVELHIIRSQWIVYDRPIGCVL